MTNETIARIIRRVNTGRVGRSVFLCPRQGFVQRGYAWPVLPDGDDRAHGYEFSFIFHDDVCVGAVLHQDDGDFHAYMKPKFRRKGLMRRAFVEVIFPRPAHEGKGVIDVSFATLAGRDFWRGIGGQVADDQRHGSIDRAAFAARYVPPPPPPSLSLDERETIRGQIRKAKQLLELAAGALAVSDLSKVATNLRDVAHDADWYRMDVPEQDTY